MSMDHKSTDTESTVQGRDTPVPVRGLSGRAGSPGPSACDRSSLPVSTQAGSGYKATGTKESDKGKGTTERRHSIGPNVLTIDLRQDDTKPERTRKASRVNLLSQLRRCNSVDTGKKRKVMDTSIDSSDAWVDTIRTAEDPIAFVIREAIEMVTKLSKDLDKRIGENPNTKREIKDIATKLKRNVEVLCRDTSTAWLDKHKWTHVPTPVYDADCQTGRSLNTSGTADTACAACQTEETMDSWGQKRREERRVDISDMAFNNFEEIIPVLEKPWQRHCYAATKITRGNTGKPNSGSVVYFVDTNSESVSKEAKRMRNLYPELAHSEITTCEGGSYVGVEQITRYNEVGVGLKTRIKHVIEMRTETGKEEREVLRGMYGMFGETRQIMEGAEDKEIGVLVPPGTSVDKLRKVAEIAFRKSGLEVNLMAVKESKDPTPKKARR